MKQLLTTAALLLTMPAFAQAPQGVSEQDMQTIMLQMQEMQECMANIDTTELKALEQRSKQLESEVKSLCSAGKRADAQDKAVDFSQEILASSAMQTMKKCTENIANTMPGLNVPDMAEQLKEKHVCDM